MSKLKLPAEIEELPEGLYKRDTIRHYKKQMRRRKNGK